MKLKSLMECPNYGSSSLIYEQLLGFNSIPWVRLNSQLWASGALAHILGFFPPQYGHMMGNA